MYPSSCGIPHATYQLMALHYQSNENISPGVIMNLAKELRKLSNEPLDGIKISVNEEDVTDVTADIMGPGISFAEHSHFAKHRETSNSHATPARS